MEIEGDKPSAVETSIALNDLMDNILMAKRIHFYSATVQEEMENIQDQYLEIFRTKTIDFYSKLTDIFLFSFFDNIIKSFLKLFLKTIATLI